MSVIWLNGDSIPDSKVHGANMGPIWGRQDPGGPHVGPMNFAIWDGDQDAYGITRPQWVNAGVSAKSISDMYERLYIHYIIYIYIYIIYHGGHFQALVCW